MQLASPQAQHLRLPLRLDPVVQRHASLQLQTPRVPLILQFLARFAELSAPWTQGYRLALARILSFLFI